MTTQKIIPTIPIANAKRSRRGSKPAAHSPHQVRRCILVHCENEAMQRELFEHLTKLGVSCRVLTL